MIRQDYLDYIQAEIGTMTDDTRIAKHIKEYENDDYTVVLDENYEMPSRPDAEAAAKEANEELKNYVPSDEEVAEAARKREEHIRKVREEREARDKREREEREYKLEMDILYTKYEEMRLKEPGILDLDDVYPHSYQWRIGDRYDKEKMAVLKEALSQGVKIEDTEAYERYVESVKHKRYSPVSWD